MKFLLFLIITGMQTLVAMESSVCDKISKCPLDRRHVEKESRLLRTFSGNVMDPHIEKKYATDTYFALQILKMRKLVERQRENCKNE